MQPTFIKNFLVSKQLFPSVHAEPVPGSNPPLSPGAIAGIVIGALAGVALIATAVFFIVKSTKSMF